MSGTTPPVPPTGDTPPPAAPQTPPPAQQASPPAASLSPAAESPRRGNGFGLASLILGIVTVAGFAIPFVNYVSIVTGVAGLVLGVIGLIIKFRPRKAAIAGVILSALGLILSIVLVIVYAALFAGASKALEGQTVGPADPSVSASAEPTSKSSFKDGILTTSNIKIEITDHKIIQIGEPGNEYGDKPVIAFYYTTTNVSGRRTDPSTAFIGTISAYQDNDPNAENQLDVGLLPDSQFQDSQLESIKKGGSVPNAIAFQLDDLTTPVDLVASEDLGITTIGKISYKLA